MCLKIQKNIPQYIKIITTPNLEIPMICRKRWLKFFLVMGTTSSVFSFLSLGLSQDFIDSLRGGMNVVATAGTGTNQVTVITLTDVNSLKIERCARLRPD